jgi:hypothetical protein
VRKTKSISKDPWQPALFKKRLKKSENPSDFLNIKKDRRFLFLLDYYGIHSSYLSRG